MKRLFAFLLAFCLMLGAVPLAYAEDGGGNVAEETVKTDGEGTPARGESPDPEEIPDPEESPAPEESEMPSEGQVPSDIQEKAPVKVSSLAELQAAIAAAEDGDTIELTQTVRITGESILSDKDITIACAEDFEDNIMFNVVGASVIGLSFKGGGADQIFAVTDYQEQETIFQDCTFDGDGVAIAISIYGTLSIYGATEANFVRIIDSEFKNCFRSAVSARTSTDVVLDRCYIHDTYAIYATAAVESSGKVTLNDCIVTENSSFANAGVLCSDTLIVSGGQIRNNIIRTTETGVSVDIYCSGTWSIIDEGTEDAGYYDVTTGEKLLLPIHGSNTFARLIYLKNEDAKEYFSFLSGGGDDAGNGADQPQEPLTEGNDNQEPPTDNGDGDGQQLPQEPSDGQDQQESQKPSTGDDNGPQEPSDKDTGTGEGTSQGPSERPSGGKNDNGYNYTPPSHWRPSTPSTSSRNPAPKDEGKEETPGEDSPLADSPKLVCGGAVLDNSRMIVLLGYGDGQQHRDDLLTRAQAAQIFQRLLTTESAVQLRTVHNAFKDVPADAWYTEAINTLANAGVLVGCGNGLFCPENNLTWAQALTILARFVEPQKYELQYIRYEGWALDSIQTAVALGWIRDSAEIVPDALITRGQMADLVNLVLELSR